MSKQTHKTEGVNRTKTVRFYPFVFTGKERDEETGYGYFGARYMDHVLTTMWLSVDPMADKYPSISPYAYCAWNPMKLVAPNGKEVDDPPYSGSGWGHSIRRFLYNKLGLSNNVNNVVEAGINPMFQSGEVFALLPSSMMFLYPKMVQLTFLTVFQIHLIYDHPRVEAMNTIRLAKY